MLCLIHYNEKLLCVENFLFMFHFYFPLVTGFCEISAKKSDNNESNVFVIVIGRGKNHNMKMKMKKQIKIKSDKHKREGVMPTRTK